MMTQKHKNKVKTLSYIVAIVLAAAVLFAVGTLAPFNAYAAGPDPEHITVTYYDGPYTRGFTWQTATGVTGGEVQMVEKTGSMTKTTVDWTAANVITVPATGSSIAYTDGTFLSWKADHNFGPAANGKTYFYRVGSAAAWSAVGEQKINGGTNGVDIIHVSDPQGRTTGPFELWKTTLAKAKTTLPEFQNITFNGDFIQEGNENKQWGYVLNMPKDILMDTALMPAAGNHDWEGSYSTPARLNARFHISMAEENANGISYFYYSYDIGNVHVTVLNTNTPDWRTGRIRPEQVTWLKEDLAAATANPEIKWKVVVQHAGLVAVGQYSTSTNASGVNVKAYTMNLRRDLMPIYAEHKVDLVMQGHEHVYTRSKPVDWAAAPADWGAPNGAAATGFETKEYNLFGETRKYMENPGGTMYVDIGPAGGSRRQAVVETPEIDSLIGTHPDTGIKTALQPESPTWEDNGKKGMFGALRIHGGVLLYETYSVDGGTGETTLIDYFGIDKDPNGVKPSPVASIAVTTQPTKKAYAVDEAANWDGMVVTATKADGTTAILPASDYTVSGFDSATIGDKTITVTGPNGKTTTFTITVTQEGDKKNPGGCACSTISMIDVGGFFLMIGGGIAFVTILPFIKRKKAAVSV